MKIGLKREKMQQYYEDERIFPAELAFFNSIYLASAKWHNGKARKEEVMFSPSSIPTLISVNKYDPVTPPENGYAFLKNLKKGQLLVIDEGGHSGAGNCQMEVIMNFLKDPESEVDASCFKRVDRKNGWD